MCRRDYQSLKADLKTTRRIVRKPTRFRFSHLLNQTSTIPADQKWRLTVRPTDKAVIREHFVGLPACPDSRPIRKDSSELVRVAPSQESESK
jgi:hypothetical protein